MESHLVGSPFRALPLFFVDNTFSIIYQGSHIPLFVVGNTSLSPKKTKSSQYYTYIVQQFVSSPTRKPKLCNKPRQTPQQWHHLLFCPLGCSRLSRQNVQEHFPMPLQIFELVLEVGGTLKYPKVICSSLSHQNKFFH